jgi:ATP-dependent phosphofructokinase / diphosphate-dependent phosphofructokinase
VDAREAHAVGRQAIRAILGGEAGKMVTIQRTSSAPYAATYGLVPLTEAANRTRSLDERYLLPDRYDVAESFLTYLEPLTGPLPVPYRLY